MSLQTLLGPIVGLLAQGADAAGAAAAAGAPAAGEGGAAPAAGGMGGLWLTLSYVVPLGVLFYLMILRPQRDQQKKQQQLVAAMKKNDRVLTEAGLYGTVVSVDAEADRMVLRIDDEKGVKVTCRKSSVVRVLDESSPKEKDKEKAAGGA